MKDFVFGGLLACLLSISGCTNPFAGRTEVTFHKTADGIDLSYDSTKEENHLTAVGNVNKGDFNISVEKAGAQDSAVAALLAAQTAVLQTVQQIMQQVAPLIENAAKTAAVSGS